MPHKKHDLRLKGTRRQQELVLDQVRYHILSPFRERTDDIAAFVSHFIDFAEYRGLPFSEEDKNRLSVLVAQYLGRKRLVEQFPGDFKEYFDGAELNPNRGGDLIELEKRLAALIEALDGLGVRDLNLLLGALDAAMVPSQPLAGFIQKFIRDGLDLPRFKDEASDLRQLIAYARARPRTELPLLKQLVVDIAWFYRKTFDLDPLDGLAHDTWAEEDFDPNDETDTAIYDRFKCQFLALLWCALSEIGECLVDSEPGKGFLASANALHRLREHIG